MKKSKRGGGGEGFKDNQEVDPENDKRNRVNFAQLLLLRSHLSRTLVPTFGLQVSVRTVQRFHENKPTHSLRLPCLIL